MRHAPSVAMRVLRSLFVSPVAYVVLSLFAVLAGFFVILDRAWCSETIFRMQQMQAFEQLAEVNLNDHLITQFLGSISVVMLFLIPRITKGLYAAAKTNGTEELMLTRPPTI